MRTDWEFTKSTETHEHCSPKSSGGRTYSPSVYLKRFLRPLNSDRALSSPPALMSLNLLRNICTRSTGGNVRRQGRTAWRAEGSNQLGCKIYDGLRIVNDTGFSVRWCTDLLLAVLVARSCWPALYWWKLLQNPWRPETLLVGLKTDISKKQYWCRMIMICVSW